MRRDVQSNSLQSRFDSSQGGEVVHHFVFGFDVMQSQGREVVHHFVFGFDMMHEGNYKVLRVQDVSKAICSTLTERCSKLAFNAF